MTLGVRYELVTFREKQQDIQLKGQPEKGIRPPIDAHEPAVDVFPVLLPAGLRSWAPSVPCETSWAAYKVQLKLSLYEFLEKTSLGGPDAH